MIRSHVLSVLKGASSQVIFLYIRKYQFKTNTEYAEFVLVFPLQVQTAIRGSGSNKTTVSEGVEASVIYVRFKAAASEVYILCYTAFVIL